MNIILQEELEIFKTTKNDAERLKAADRVYQILKDKKIILYGAGDVGKSLLASLNDLKIMPEFFVDKRYEEVVDAGPVKVYPVEALAQCKDEDVVVIIAIDAALFLEYKEEISNNIMSHCPNASVVTSGRILTLLLRHQTCQSKFLSGKQFDLVECIKCNGENLHCDVFDKYVRSIASKSEIDKSDFPLKFNKYVGFITGNVCTLRCKCCCEMVPFHKERGFADADTIINDCRKIADATQFTLCMELVGGEPFLHPKIAYILSELLKIPDVGYVKVFTNGTVVPDEQLLDVLKNPRIIIMWSNYQDTIGGKQWENVEKTRALFEREGIHYIYSVSKTWLDFSSFDYVEKTDEMLESDFQDCFMKTIYRVYDGVLYRCPHQYAAVRLNKITCEKGDCIKLKDSDSLCELSREFLEFKKKKYADACRYCVVPHKAKEVPAGEQLEDDR
jgi:hypothetical protein